MRYLGWAIVFVVLVAALRRTLIWAASKGSIYYGDSERPRFSAGNALSMFQPEIEHVIEQDQWGYVEDVDNDSSDDHP